MDLVHLTQKTQLKVKSDIESKKYREEGNRLHAKWKYFEAILAYNKSLTFAESKINLALAYGNRSAAYFHAKRYNECIDNIKLARENGFPKNKMVKLDEREQKCLEAMMADLKGDEADQNALDYFKLSSPANEKIPWIAEGLEMIRTKKYGRGIYATREFNTGDIICVEEIFAIYAITGENGYYKHCANCFKTKILNLIPCHKTASFMFCTLECRDVFHKHADADLLKVDEMFNYKILLSKIESAFNGRNQLVRYLENNKTGATSIFEHNFAHGSPSEKKLNLYKCFLASSVSPMFKSSTSNKPHRPSTEELLKHLRGIAFANVIKYHNYLEKVDHSQPAADGLVFTTFTGLVNSSCVSNISQVCVDNKVIYYVNKPIKSNQQLFYAALGEFHAGYPSRASFLSRVMGFKCDCIACVLDLSLSTLEQEYPNMKPLKEVMIEDVDLENLVQKVEKYFKILKICTTPSSKERATSLDNVGFLLFMISSLAMYPY